jgi:hypothetical protein
MTETTASGPPTNRRFRSWHAPRGWRRSALRIALILLLILAVYTLARRSAVHEIDDYKIRNAQLLRENGKLTLDTTNKTTQLLNLQAQLKSTQDKLNAITPSENTYRIGANESLPLADGRLTIGLIGAPKSEAVDLNINGKQQSAVAGDIINFAPDPSTTCRLEVVSFDVLQALAVIKATCAAVKP